MTDWARTYNPTWSYCLVNRATWLDSRPLRSVVSCSLKWDESAVPESATIEVDERIPPESIIRVYLDAEQDGSVERHAVATVVATADDDAFGTVESTTLQCYGPLMALEDDVPSVLQCVSAGTFCAAEAARICGSSGIAPVIPCPDDVMADAVIVADPKETLLGFARSVAAKAGMDVVSDPYGRTAFKSLPGLIPVPKAVFRDDGKTVLVGDVKRRRDLRKVPNYCEVRVTNGTATTVGRAVNDDPASVVSTASRGRRVPLIVENPDDLPATCSQAEADAYAARKLEEESRVSCEVSYSHDFVPLAIGDWVRIVRSDLDVYATVSSMSLNCDTQCNVDATATFTETYWEAR